MPESTKVFSPSGVPPRGAGLPPALTESLGFKAGSAAPGERKGQFRKQELSCLYYLRLLVPGRTAENAAREREAEGRARWGEDLPLFLSRG